MKKMMLMVAIVGIAVGVQAATVTWQAGSLKTAGVGGAFTTTALNGAIAYLIQGASTAGVDAAIEAGTFTGAGALASKLTTSTGSILQASIGSFSNQDVSLYMVIFDGATIATSSYYMISTVYTQTFTTANKTYNFTTAPTHMPTAWTAIPEPTSMALLAVGGAVLGLRRKFRK